MSAPRALDTVTCSLCGTRYDEKEGRACTVACPLAHDCGLCRCPRCGYETPAPTRLTRFLSRWLHPQSARG